MSEAKLASGDVNAAGDQRVILRDVSWTDYETMLAIRGDDRPGVRFYYLEGDLELMSPSHTHEWIKKTLARLLEAYADHRGIDLNGYGSLTMRKAPKKRGAEPDECYVVGLPRGKSVKPDLAIEVIWTTDDGLDKMDIYSGLGVGELWICRPVHKKFVVEAFVLRRGRYLTAAGSRLFPDLDLGFLASFLETESQSQAVRAFRQALRKRGDAQ